ncbi:hypothetical protein [Arthrobacter castelli]|uniref:hypothetical protein n=1 Tax=Arthrobacter castelli TaxID=271431 RepID=UPI00040EB550|nr:hypothetical protein [Arthrobacter castelli]
MRSRKWTLITAAAGLIVAGVAAPAIAAGDANADVDTVASVSEHHETNGPERMPGMAGMHQQMMRQMPQMADMHKKMMQQVPQMAQMHEHMMANQTAGPAAPSRTTGQGEQP